MPLEFWANLSTALGTLLIAFAALRVHHRVLNEHKIDRRVFKVMRREQLTGIAGAILIVVGFLIENFLV